MNNEIINNEMGLEEIEEATEVMEVCEALEPKDNKKLIGLVIGAVAVGAAALIYKNRKKFEAWQIKRLEKKGYVVHKPESDRCESDYENSCDEQIYDSEETE